MKAMEVMVEIPQPPTVADSVAERVLALITSGEFEPGDKINDQELAVRFGVSRTPVREALQRLRIMGIIETSAYRYTRVAVPGFRAIDECRVVWAALFGAVIDEVVPSLDDEVLAASERAYADYERAVAEGRAADARDAAYLVYIPLLQQSENEILVRTIEANLHLYALALRATAMDHAESPLVGMFTGEAAQQIVGDVVDGLRRRDSDLCNGALRRLVRWIQQVPSAELAERG